ncbi:MAG: hypothetical protein LBG76_03375 [Treponema sp.]|jgi:hypothetical protein|nr:hypothetical protein [Treponema sp.]
MKVTITVLIPLLFAAACEPAIPPVYRLDPPVLPSAWEETLGSPHWRIEWLGPDGRILSLEEAALPAIEIAPERANPVLAYPFWPERGIAPGAMRPAGGIFPFDASSSLLRLSWRGGVEGSFFRALNAAHSTGAEDSGISPLRRGECFDWPRFRELLNSDSIPAAIREDPWLADWRSLAERTARSGFDRRRIVIQAREELAIPLPADGPWIGPSPFAAPLPWEAGNTVIAGVTGAVDTYISPGGILHCTRGAWNWIPFIKLAP